jgi:hypothetical protein
MNKEQTLAAICKSAEPRTGVRGKALFDWAVEHDVSGQEIVNILATGLS